jgi:hypothetical protein
VQQPSLQQQLEQLLQAHPALRQALAAQAGLVPNSPPPAAAPAAVDSGSMQRAASAAGESRCLRGAAISLQHYAPLQI